MDVLRFGTITRTAEGVLSITGFSFIDGEPQQANDPNFVIPAVIRSLATTFPGTVEAESFNAESEIIVMRAIEKAKAVKL